MAGHGRTTRGRSHDHTYFQRWNTNLRPSVRRGITRRGWFGCPTPELLGFRRPARARGLPDVGDAAGGAQGNNPEDRILSGPYSLHTRVCPRETEGVRPDPPVRQISRPIGDV